MEYVYTKDGILSAAPYIVMAVVAPLTGWIADTLREKSILSTTATRKLVNTPGTLKLFIYLLFIFFLRSVVACCFLGFNWFHFE